MTWLEDLLGIQTIYKDGVAQPARKAVDFIGNDWQLVDNPGTARIEIRSSSSTDYKSSVRVATSAALPANTRVGNSLTADANGALPSVDGVSLVLNDRLLVRNEGGGIPSEKHGIYVVTDVGSASTPWVLTRANDAAADADVTAGMVVPVEEGTANGDKLFLLTTNAPIVLNSTALAFSVFGAGASLSAPATPADDDRVAFAATGDLDYASGVKIAAAGAALLLAAAANLPTSGDLRLSSNAGASARTLIATRKNANGADIALVTHNYGAVADYVRFGDETNAARIYAAANTDFVVRIGAGQPYQQTATLGTFLASVALRPTSAAAATTGMLRFENAGGAASQLLSAVRNNANSGNLDLIRVNHGGVADRISFGDPTNVPQTTIVSSAVVALRIASTDYWALSASRVSQGLAEYRWDSAVASPKIYQQDDTGASATGDPFIVQAQNATGTTSTGGALELRAGTGTSTNGFINVGTSSSAWLRFATPVASGNFPGSGVVRFSGPTAATATPLAAIRNNANTQDVNVLGWNHNGSANQLSVGDNTWITNTYLQANTSLVFQVNSAQPLVLTIDTIKPRVAAVEWISTVASPTLSQADDSTASVTGDTLLVHAQNATGTTATGGKLDLRSGTGTSVAGAVSIGVGSSEMIALTGGKVGSLKSGSFTCVTWDDAGGTAAQIGFLGATSVARQTVTGSRGGNAALASALTALANLGLITDSSSA